MELTFAKLNGLGNDFVMVDDRDCVIELTPEQVAWLCDRHFGIGGDGVILVRPPKNEGSHGYMHYINSDGTLAQMCGNGVRCFAKFLVDRGIVDPQAGSLVADTLAGPKPINFTIDEEGRMIEAQVDMGEPILDPALVPVALEANATDPVCGPYVKEAPLDSPWGTFKFTMVSMGNPHAICFIDDWSQVDDRLFADPSQKSLQTLDINAIGAFFEANPVFPEKTNVEFADIEDDGIHMRVFERGCGETLACGTGTCATNVAAALTGRAGRSNAITLLGGTLKIDWDEQTNHILMTGPAAEAFAGTVTVS